MASAKDCIRNLLRDINVLERFPVDTIIKNCTEEEHTQIKTFIEKTLCCAECTQLDIGILPFDSVFKLLTYDRGHKKGQSEFRCQGCLLYCHKCEVHYDEECVSSTGNHSKCNDSDEDEEIDAQIEELKKRKENKKRKIKK